MIVLPRLNAIVDADAAARSGWSLETLTAAFLEGGARFFQLRGKSLSGAALLAAARAMAGPIHRAGGLLVVNDRADVARLSGADGVHLGQTDLPPAAARRILGDRAIVGRSTHTATELEAAAGEPVTYLAIGPVFGTATKDTGHAAVGLDMVRRAAATGIPVVAIGGITLDAAPAVIDAGARAVAIIADLLAGDSPERRARSYVERLSRL